MAQVPLYCYCQPAVGILDSKGPLSHTIARSILAEVNKEVKIVTAGQKKRQDLYELYLPFTPEEKVQVAQCGSVNRVQATASSLS